MEKLVYDNLYSINKVMEAMLHGKSLALNREGKEFWKSHLKKVWKVVNVSVSGCDLCDPNTHTRFDNVSFDQIKL